VLENGERIAAQMRRVLYECKFDEFLPVLRKTGVRRQPDKSMICGLPIRFFGLIRYDHRKPSLEYEHFPLQNKYLANLISYLFDSPLISWITKSMTLSKQQNIQIIVHQGFVAGSATPIFDSGQSRNIE
jgi:hypothetical protein